MSVTISFTVPDVDAAASLLEKVSGKTEIKNTVELTGVPADKPAGKKRGRKKKAKEPTLADCQEMIAKINEAGEIDDCLEVLEQFEVSGVRNLEKEQYAEFLEAAERKLAELSGD